MEAKKINTLGCYECENHRVAFFNEYLVGCVLLKDWLTHTEIKTGCRKKLDNCPLEKK